MPVLSRMLDYREEHGQDSDALKRASPIAWQHINFYGKYEFNIRQEPVDMDTIIQELAQSKFISEIEINNM